MNILILGGSGFISGTLARWTIKIEQLTEEEAKLYKPRNP